jgi:type VI secretion system protein ImpK
MTDLRQQVAVTRATELARSGDLDSAAALLTDLSEPAALDLLARIRAQQKRWAEADALWAQVQKTAPDDAAAAAGRKTVAAIRKHRRAARPVLPIVGAVVLVGAVVAGGLFAVGRGTDAPAAEPVVQPTSATPTVDNGAEQRAAELARRLAEMEAQRRASAAALAAELATLQQQAAAPGVQAQRGTSVVRVVFLDGVFTAGTDLSPSGQAALDALGKRLPGMKASITVTGFSVVVPGGSSSGGSRTALLRARVATQQLSTASGLPLTAFTMQSGDQAHPPYRTDAKNRTVTVTLTPLTMR